MAPIVSSERAAVQATLRNPHLLCAGRWLLSGGRRCSGRGPRRWYHCRPRRRRRRRRRQRRRRRSSGPVRHGARGRAPLRRRGGRPGGGGGVRPLHGRFQAAAREAGLERGRRGAAALPRCRRRSRRCGRRRRAAAAAAPAEAEPGAAHLQARRTLPDQALPPGGWLHLLLMKPCSPQDSLTGIGSPSSLHLQSWSTLPPHCIKGKGPST